jgi:hypothetical protein
MEKTLTMHHRLQSCCLFKSSLCILGLLFFTVVNFRVALADEPEPASVEPSPNSQGDMRGENSRGGRFPNGRMPDRQRPDRQMPDGQMPDGRNMFDGQSDDSPLENLLPRFRGRVVVLEINARVIEQNQTVVWNESHRKITLLGRPVGLKLVGNNVVVAVQFTPYMRRGAGCFLVAQGQIWMDIPEQGIRYHTTMQTIPVEFGEQIYFFPLGTIKQENATGIEVMLSMQPYEEE